MAQTPPDAVPDTGARILIECLRRAVGGDRAGEELAGLLRIETGWDELLARAAHHRIVPAVSTVLTRGYSGLLPDELPGRLAGFARSNARLGELLQSALSSALERLAAGGVRSLPWGGSAYSIVAPATAVQRQHWGAEILVDAGSSGAAIQLLEEAGYRPWRARVGPASRALRRIEGSEALVEPVNGNLARIHWRVHGGAFGVQRSFESIWSRSTESEAGGPKGRLTAPRDLVAAACVKGSSHRWRRLSRVMEVAVLSGLVPPGEWPGLLSDARELGFGRMLRVGLLLAEKLSAAVIPRELATEIRSDGVAVRMAEAAWSSLLNSTRPPGGALGYELMARDRAGSKVALLAGTLFSPSREDYRACPLPSALHPLYALIRPARLLSRRLFGRRASRGAESLGPYLGSAPEAIQRMLSMARVGPEDTVYDLGCGDGRIVIAAARECGARGVGVELDGALVEKARGAARAAGVQDRVRFEIGDAQGVDLKDATVVALYLPPAAVLELRGKLSVELRPGARIVAHEVDIPGWRPERVEVVPTDRGITQVHLWRVGA